MIACALSRPGPVSSNVTTGSPVLPSAAHRSGAQPVSMPCQETFLAQPLPYRNEILPPDVRARVCVEALSPLGWHRFAGDGGEVVGMETFGASAPASKLFEHFGFTPERVARIAHAVIERTKA